MDEENKEVVGKNELNEEEFRDTIIYYCSYRRRFEEWMGTTSTIKSSISFLQLTGPPEYQYLIY
mgnify:CR=1 FL=1